MPNKVTKNGTKLFNDKCLGFVLSAYKNGEEKEWSGFKATPKDDVVMVRESSTSIGYKFPEKTLQYLEEEYFPNSFWRDIDG